jgi:hypothetical protein
MSRRRYTEHEEYLQMAARITRNAGVRVGKGDPEDLAELIKLQDNITFIDLEGPIEETTNDY